MNKKQNEIIRKLELKIEEEFIEGLMIPVSHWKNLPKKGKKFSSIEECPEDLKVLVDAFISELNVYKDLSYPYELRYSYKLQMRDKWILIKDYFTEEGLKEILEKIMIYPK